MGTTVATFGHVPMEGTMFQGNWMGLDFGQWLAIVVLVLLIAAIARYLLIELPRDRQRQ